MRALRAPKRLSVVAKDGHIGKPYKLLGDVTATHQVSGDRRVEKTCGVANRGDRVAHALTVCGELLHMDVALQRILAETADRHFNCLAGYAQKTGS